MKCCLGGESVKNNRWKVLIADDEPVIREGIRDSIDWASLQMEVIAEAEDGEEALELALNGSIHVLLADLNMPIMDGLTLIKQIKHRLPQCKILIISGHDEFTYAQEAVRLNVTDYILKPVEPDQLKKVLMGIVQELEEHVKVSEYLEMASNQISRNMMMLREQFCREWIEGRIKEEEIISQLEILKLPTKNPHQIAIIYVPEYLANKPLMTEKEKHIYEFLIKNIVTELLEVYPNLIFADQSGLMVLILWDSIPTTLFERMEQLLKEYLKMSITIYMKQTDKEDIQKVYEDCKSSIFGEVSISPIVRRAKKYIEEHYTEPTITLENVANILQVSSVYLSRSIKKDLGMSFVSLVTNLRVKKAIQLLNSTNLPIVEIAESVGYDTQHYFSTAFKKVVGVSPNKYRKNAGLVSN